MEDCSPRDTNSWVGRLSSALRRRARAILDGPFQFQVHVSLQVWKEKAVHLSGIRVLDLSHVVSGAVTTMLLADFGAEVIKVEPPEGEPYRRHGPALGDGKDGGNLNFVRWS